MNAITSYWRWIRSGPKWKLVAGIGGPILALLVIIGIAGGSNEKPQTSSDQDRVGVIVGTFPPTSQASVPPGVQARVIRVIDGDTIEVDRALDGRATVRYIGIDTPETVAPGSR
jgi:hypothetical protein